MATIKIGELLVEEGLISRAQLDEALTAQQIYGGRLGTNLVEHDLVCENELARVLSKQLGIPVVDRDALADVDAKVIALLPRETAQKFSVVPFAIDEEKDRVSLAMTDPTNLHQVDSLQFALGKRVQLFLCPEIVLAHALEKYYKIPRERRFIKLEGTSGVRSGGGSKKAEKSTGGKGRTITRLLEATTNQETLSFAANALRGFAGQVAFLVTRGDRLCGWLVRGLPVPEDTLRTMGLPYKNSPTLQRLAASPHPARVDCAQDPALRGLLEGCLFMDCAEPVLMLPLVVNQQVFGCYVLAQVDERTVPKDPEVLAELMRRVGYKLQALHLMDCVGAPLAGCP